MLTLILALTPWMGTPFSTLSRWPASIYSARLMNGLMNGLMAKPISLDIERRWLLLSLGLLLPVGTSTRTMIATAPTANHHQLVKLRERFLKTCGRHGDD